MAGLMQGDPLPNITTTKSTATTAPDWYTSYLKNLADTGTTAMSRTPDQLVAGFSPLQAGAIAATPQAGASYQPFLGQANTYLGAGAGSAADTVQDFMNPYESNVIQGIRDAGERNIRNNIAPMAAARGVTAGDFGSKRSQEIYGQTMADAQQDLTNTEAQYRAAGYSSALAAAQAEKTRELNAATTAGALGTTAQTLGLTDVNATYGMGQKEQELAQARINAPMTMATNASNLLTNLKVPSTVSETANAPIPGAYSNSPLSQIAGLSSLFASGGYGGKSAASNFAGMVGDAYTGLRSLFPGSSGSSGSGGSYSGTGDAYYGGSSGAGSTGQSAAEIYGSSGADVRGGMGFGGTGSGTEYEATGGLDPSQYANADFDDYTPYVPYQGYTPGGGSYEQGGQDNYFDFYEDAPFAPYTPNYQLPEYYEDY